jgi:toxin ParE1/3/4
VRVITSDWGKSQLRNIYSYYKERATIKVASQIRSSILNRFKELLLNPEMGQEENSLIHLQLGHRYLVEGHYKIIYRIIGNDIRIEDIFDTRQHPGKMKA